MTGFVMGFVVFVGFVLLVAGAALLFLAYDPPAVGRVSKALTQHFPAVRRINTSTIETVDNAGKVQRWQRLP
ncbi:MAG: hypothetical protein ACOCZH_03565 [Phototrophicaceae bacterium]